MRMGSVAFVALEKLVKERLRRLGEEAEVQGELGEWGQTK